jgi:hypothetical protein
MFSARCYQKAKKTYPKKKILAATIAIHLAVYSIVECSCLTSLPLPKVSATDPIIKEIEGINIPAIIAPIVPITSITQSL